MVTCYQTFLESSDLAAWVACLDGYLRKLERLGEAGDLEELVEGLCVSVYAQWLAVLSGSYDTQQHTRAAYDRFVEALRVAHHRAPCMSTRRGWGVVLAWNGYRRTARIALTETGALGPELQLLIAPEPAAEKVAALRPLLAEPTPRPFAPVLYFHCDALIDLGAITEVDRLLIDGGLNEADPMACGLWAKMHERAGRWGEAAKLYGRSSWPAHRYRAAMSRKIAASSSAPNGDPELMLDEALRRELVRMEPEIDQIELARSSSLVNACLWGNHDGWVLQLELGKLHFRRRRYAEADAHLKRAVALAPPSARFVVAHTRWVNLTWLDNKASHDLPMEPEALVAARAALDASETVQEHAPIRTWIAGLTRELTLLPSDIASWDVFEQGRAHAIVGNDAEELDCGLRYAREKYDHRNLGYLVRAFGASRFERCVECLLEVVIRESHDDFFALWETAPIIVEMLGYSSESSLGFARLDARLTTIEDRLFRLSQFHFQHLIRAHRFFSERQQHDRAEELIRRAARLAEGAAEHLAVAIARRSAEWFSASRGDSLGLECLLRADRESRDRLERLQIARELFHYGRTEHARDILQEEGVLTGRGRMEPIEHIVALQCGDWLDSEEFAALAARAARDLVAMLETGAIAPYGHRFVKRLLDTLKVQQWAGLSAEPPAQAQGIERRDPLQPSPWTTCRRKMEAAISKEDFEQELTLFEDELARISTSSSFAQRLTVWSWIRRQIEEALGTAAEVRPKVDPGATPISKSLTLDDDRRALEVSDLWRRYLTAADAESRRAAMAKVEAFGAMEQRLLEEWETMRQERSERALRRALYYAQAGSRLLPIMVSATEQREAHPVLADLYRCAAIDGELQLQRLFESIAAIHQQLWTNAS